MKNQQWLGKIYGIAALGLLSLTACQTARDLEPQQAAYQQKTNKVLGNYAQTITNAFKKARGITSSGRAVIGSTGYQQQGSWNPFGGSPFGGYYAASAIDREMDRCRTQIESFGPPSVQNALLRLLTLDRCTNVAINYRNPLSTFGYQGLDPYSQYYYTYALNYPQFGGFNQMPGQAFGAWTFYAGNGVYPGSGYPGGQQPGGNGGVW